MTIIVFLVDTSASMNQRTYLGTTLLDVAKGAVETFMKIRSRDPNCRWDRYMLLTFDDPPANVKAGWKESHATFTRELKNLEAIGLSTLGPALKYTFDLLNINRMLSGIDTYGQGRCPFYLEPAIIICLTDGGKMTTSAGASFELNLPMTNVAPGSELTKEPFRWDQRVFGIVLRMPATPPGDPLSTYIPSATDTALDAMCEVTGGRSYSVVCQRALIACLESLVQKCQSGVVVNFEKIGPETPVEMEKNGVTSRPASPTQSAVPLGTSWQNCRRLIYVPRSAQKGYTVGHWPVPESFWPDANSDTLPPRSAHPLIKFSCMPCDPMVMENLPFDKYECEPSPLTQFILERRQPNVAWQVFIANSAKYNEIGHPFGYLKASTSNQTVNLFVMPYNYPQLIPLLDELFKVHKLKPNQKWRQQFDNYLKTMPAYYAAPLKRAMKAMGSPNFVPEQIEGSTLSYTVVSYLKKLKNQAKTEYDRLIATVGQPRPLCPDKIRVESSSKRSSSILGRADFHQLLARHGGNLSGLTQELSAEGDSIELIVAGHKPFTSHVYLNPYDIPRKDLLTQIRRMRTNFMKAALSGLQLKETETLFNMSVQDMGNYQEYLKRLPQPLREIETQPARQHTFGNPFKVNKNLMIDEADEAMPGQQTSRKRVATDGLTSPRHNKRKPGPLPRGVPVNVILSPVREVATPPPSPYYQTFADNLMSPAPSDFDEECEGIDDLVILDKVKPDDIARDNDRLTNHVGECKTNGEILDITDMSASNGGESLVATSGCIPYATNNIGRRLSSSSSLPPVNGIKAHDKNIAIIKLAVKHVKRPGKDFVSLFELLNGLHGNVDERCTCIQTVAREAERFKRLVLVEKLSDLARSVRQSSVTFRAVDAFAARSPSLEGLDSMSGLGTERTFRASESMMPCHRYSDADDRR